MVKIFSNTIWAICLVFLLATSCKLAEGEDSDSLPSSSGKYGEVLVVVDTVYSNGKVGEKINELFLKAVEATPQKEASFRMSTVDPAYFKSILKRSRNLLRVSISKSNANKVKLDRNVWAKDQLFINIYADSEASAIRILDKNMQTIRDYFNEEELKRLSKQYRIKPNTELIEEIKSRYEIELLIPPAFVMMQNDSNSFWMKKEKSIGQHQVVQGLVFYEHPYSSDSTFTSNYMMEMRDEFSQKMIEGSRDSSYMQVYREYKPNRSEISLDENYAVEFKGLWNMKNDFMGGPFIHYTLVDQENNRVINLDAFVFAPKFNKREYLRELEAIIKSLKLN